MNKNQIHARLIEQGSNFRQFALTNGYPYRTVIAAVDRWAGSKKLPRGLLTFHILRDLSRQIGTDVIPGIRSTENN